MKKSLIPILSMAMFCMMSCNNSSVKSTDDTADSLSNDTCCQLAPGEVSDELTEGNDNFMSPDTKLNDLHGLVKKCVYRKSDCDKDGKPTEYAYWYEEVKVFDRDGFLDLKSKELNWRLNDPKVERNDQKQITKVQWYVSDFDSYVTEKYTYNERGLLATCKAEGVESSDLTEYEYDNDTLIKSTNHGSGEGSVFRNTAVYTILDTDDQGNWTRRISKQIFEDGPDDGSNTYGNAATSYVIEERTITYYE